MKKSMFFMCVGLSMSLVYPSFAQEDINGGPINSRTETGVIDGVVLSTHIPTKRLIPYEHVREADVIWSKRVWRTLDMREKLNHPLYFPHDEFTAPDFETGKSEWIRNSSRWSLWTVIRHHIITGDLTVYRNENPIYRDRKDGDEFKYPVLPDDPNKDYSSDSAFRAKIDYFLADEGPQPETPLMNMYDEDSIGADGNYVFPPRPVYWVQSEDIIQYKIKEDWFFDKERSVLDVRILGICPVRYAFVDAESKDEISGTIDMFWLYFPTDCRYVFNNYFVYNERNGSRWMSYDDYFWKRRFSSFIHKEENVYDRKVEQYRVGLDALRESDNIRENIRNFEHDLWSF